MRARTICVKLLQIDRDRFFRLRNYSLFTKWFLTLFLILISFRSTSQSSSTNHAKPKHSHLIYIAKRVYQNQEIETIKYDSGRYQILSSKFGHIVDNRKPQIEWDLYVKEKRAILDARYSLLKLYEDIQKKGVKTVSHQSKIDIILLDHFASTFKPGRMQNVDHLLQFVNIDSRKLKENYRITGSETLLNRKCIIYTSIYEEGMILSIDPETGCVMHEKDKKATSIDGKPVIRDFMVVELQFLNKAPSDLIDIPPNYTAEVPRIFANIVLPPKVHRKIKSASSGNDEAYLGYINFKFMVEQMERANQPLRKKK